MKFVRTHKKLFTIFLGAGLIELFALLLDGPVLSGLLLSLQAFLLYLWLFFRGSEQALMPRDGLSELRNLILFFIVAALILGIPSIVYAVSRLYGLDLEWLRSVTNVSGGLQKIAAPMLLVLVFEYKIKEKE